MRTSGLIPAAVLALLAFTAPASAQEQERDATRQNGLEQRVDELDQKVRILQRQRELEQEAAAAKAKEAAAVVAGKDGFALKSADGYWVVKLRGYVQLDSRTFGDDEGQLVDTFTLRRVRPVLEGTLARIYDFRVMPDFGEGKTTLFDAYLDARFDPALGLRAGKFKPPVGLERLQSATAILFVERGFPTLLVPNRDLGLMLHGDVAGGVLGYELGYFNGVADGDKRDLDTANGKDVAARVMLQPFARRKSVALSGLRFGVAGTSGTERGTSSAPGLASYKTAGQTFFAYAKDALADGDRTRVSPQLYWSAGPVSLLAESVSSRQEVRAADGDTTARLDHRAWQVSASWVVTGEATSWNGVKPKKPLLGPNGGGGALELALRRHRIAFDSAAFPVFASPDKSSRSAAGWTVGLNWYVDRNVKFVLNYDRTSFRGGAPAGEDREDERLLACRFQVSF
ncbi:MAG: porin [Acidobacteria bacterium]|nr:porin [Acidobacteriota bacterium]